MSSIWTGCTRHPGFLLVLAAGLWGLSPLIAGPPGASPYRTAQSAQPGDRPAASPGPDGAGGGAKDQSRLKPGEEVLPEISYDPSKLPEPVRAMRKSILDAARSGDMERLRKIIEAGKKPPEVSFGGADDPIAFWKRISIDGTGRDVLADIVRIFEAGYVHLGAGTDNDLFVWPYHFAYPLGKLTPRQQVELYMLIPAEYRDGMEQIGGYTGFRAGISPDGTWQFFIAGD